MKSAVGLHRTGSFCQGPVSILLRNPSGQINSNVTSFSTSSCGYPSHHDTNVTTYSATGISSDSVKYNM